MNRYESFPEVGGAGARRRDHYIVRIVIIALALVILLACAVGAAAFLNDGIARKLGVDAWISDALARYGLSQTKPASPNADARLAPKLAATASATADPVSVIHATPAIDTAKLGAKLSTERARIADKLPTLTIAQTIDGKLHQPTAFPLSANADGVLSESSRIMIHGLPEGTVLSAGHPAGAGNWLLAPDDLNGKLTITPGGAAGSTSDLLIQLAGSNGQVASELHTALKLSGPAHPTTMLEPVRVAATPDEIRAWMSHGRDLERVGYFAGARLFFRHAAEGGSAEGAHAMGETYDPVEFQKLDVHGLKPDPVLAEKWYARAKVLAAQPAVPQTGKVQ